MSDHSCEEHAEWSGKYEPVSLGGVPEAVEMWGECQACERELVARFEFDEIQDAKTGDTV